MKTSVTLTTLTTEGLVVCPATQLEARLEDGKQELQAEYDQFHSHLQAKLHAQEDRYRKVKAKHRRYQEVRE